MLDPAMAKAFVGRIVFTGLCDKLVDLAPDLKIIPQLATEWSWSDDNKSLTMKLRQGVTFHDGEPFNAEAVKFNLERSLNQPGSARRSEIVAIQTVDVVDPYTVRLNLSEPSAPLLAALSDRAGMMISPKAAQAAGDNFARAPVCSGPYKFVERIAQDRIVLEKFDKHWNAAAFPVQRVVYLPIPDTTVRLANLQSGGLEIIERTAPADLPTVRSDSSLKLEQATSLGYQGITLQHGEWSAVRTTCSPRTSRSGRRSNWRSTATIINQVGFEGEHTIGNQPVAPNNPFYAKTVPVQERDLERAKKLMDEAGHGRVKVELMTPNNPEQLRVAEVIQALTGEAGFDVSVNATEFATGLDRQTRGDFEAFLIGWSGRADPDGNTHNFISCKGGLNDGKYCNPEVDAHLNAARTTTDLEARKAEYQKAAEIYLADHAADLPLPSELVLGAVVQGQGLQAASGRDDPPGRRVGLQVTPVFRRRRTAPMLAFMARRLAVSIPTLLLISLLVFSLQLLLPGDPALAIAGDERTPEMLAFIREKYHLNDPIVVQYWYWLTGVLSGDMGISIRSQMPVTELILTKLPVTLQLGIMAMIIALAIGIPAGIISAVRKGSGWDVGANVVALSGISIPNFWLGIMLIMLVSVQWGLLPASGYTSPLEDPVRNIQTMIMPAFVLGTGIAAIMMRHTRSSMLSSLQADYVRTARAKGLSERVVVLRHAFRNALIPVVTLGTLQLGELLSGAVLTEQIFTIPGFGKLIVDAVFNRDYAVVQGVVLFTGTAFILMNLLADMLYFLLNPRLRA